MEKTNKLLVSLVAILALLIVGFGAYQVGDNKPAEVVNNTIVVKETIVDNSTALELAEIKAQLASLDEFEIEADEKLQNDTAKLLVLEEKDKKAFKVDLFELLDEDYDIEEYKDLTITSFVIDEVELDGDDAIVTATLKVEFDEFNDNDFTKKATIEVIFDISGLDVEDLSDSEIDGYEFDLLRVKDLD